VQGDVGLALRASVILAQHIRLVRQKALDATVPQISEQGLG
jgi:hypothetical protein